LKLGRYEVVRELGKGAMGIVYLAKDPVIGRLVALKTIRVAVHADDDESKEFQQRFIREAQAAGILNHPSIVTVHDIGQDDGLAVSFIAMEYVEGFNLKEVLNQGRNLTYEQIADIVSQVAEALDFAHAKGIVHRDVKPANIILLEGNRAKITDFGIAKIASGAANLTTTGQFLGTPNYMAPEQVKGAPVDGRTDIFALGICLYECLTRRKPFGGDSLTSISYKIVHEPFPPLREINSQIPDGFEEIVAHCLAKDPTKRYQRARDLAAALRAVMRGERPAGPAEPMLGEETMVTRERDRTVEVPFPEALEETPAPGVGTRAIPPATPAASSAAPAAASLPTVARPRPLPVSQRLRTTLTNVRALPLWRRRIPAPIFISIVAALVAVLLAGIVAMRARQVDVPVVDTKAEARVARERQLRLEGDALVRQGRVTDAYPKFAELQRIAPRSPYVANVMQKLNAIRQLEEVGKQQLAQAQAKLQEGLTLFNAKKYADSILRFQESATLNPNAPEPAQYIQIAQQEMQKADEAARLARQQRQQGRIPPPTTTGREETATVATATQATTTVSAQPASFNTVFTHPFTDGNMIVRIGGDIVASERLYADRPARFLRRAGKEPRPINVTREFPAKNADVQVWVSVPSLSISENHNISGARFEPGSTHRLIVRYNPATKKFTYELN
jgi:predicted Ser/Thr protein kinase